MSTASSNWLVERDLVPSDLVKEAWHCLPKTLYNGDGSPKVEVGGWEEQSNIHRVLLPILKSWCHVLRRIQR